MARTTATPARTRPGTYFLSLTVENVRCFGPEQTLDLSGSDGRYARWTIILGENGVGKTTLLTCLACLAIRPRDLAETPHLWEWLETRLDLARGTGSSEGIAKAIIVSSAGPAVNSRRELVIRRSGSRFKAGSLFEPLMAFCYGASRRMPRRESLADDDKRVGRFLDDDAVLRDPEDWLLRADYNARLGKGDKMHSDAFATFAKRVRNALINILPDVTEIRIRAPDEPGGAPQVEGKTPDGWVALRQLGFGYQSQIAWLVDFASRMFERYPDSPDPLAEPAVVLVDEIDLHMHPRWQRQVIAYLTELCPATQFIVTAHSPLVVQAAKGANIVLLRREGDHVVIDNDPEVLDNWRVDQILTSELFGLESARPPQIEKQLEERRTLLAKSRLTSRDRGRLARLEAEIGDLPAGENAEDRRAMDLIREIAGKLKSGA